MIRTLTRLRATSSPCVDAQGNAIIGFQCAYNTATSELADLYQSMRYGTVPLPVVAPVPVPTPAQLSSPDVATQLAQAQQDASAAATDNAIQQAINDGTYNPDGTLPGLTVPSWIYWAGAGLAAVVLLGAVRR